MRRNGPPSGPPEANHWWRVGETASMSPHRDIGSGSVARSCSSSCIPVGTVTAGGVAGGGVGGGFVGFRHFPAAAFRLPHARFLVLAGCARFLAVAWLCAIATLRASVLAASSTSPLFESRYRTASQSAGRAAVPTGGRPR